MKIIVQSLNKNKETGQTVYGAEILKNKTELNRVISATVDAMAEDYDLEVTFCIMAVRK